MSAILIVEDDENLRLVLRDNLEDEGYDVDVAATVAEARATCRSTTFDLLILDIMLPDGDGYSLCRELRDGGLESMVLMLTARTLEDDLLRGFEAGADDYLAKPYRLRELLARVQALLRRRGAAVQSSIPFDRFQLDLAARRVTDDRGEQIELTKTEFDLLKLLLEQSGRVLSRDEILDRVWGSDVVVAARTVDNFVSSIKKKLDWSATARFEIQTVRGIGYRMELR